MFVRNQSLPKVKVKYGIIIQQQKTIRKIILNLKQIIGSLWYILWWILMNAKIDQRYTWGDNNGGDVYLLVVNVLVYQYMAESKKKY